MKTVEQPEIDVWMEDDSFVEALHKLESQELTAAETEANTDEAPTDGADGDTPEVGTNEDLPEDSEPKDGNEENTGDEQSEDEVEEENATEQPEEGSDDDSDSGEGEAKQEPGSEDDESTDKSTKEQPEDGKAEPKEESVRKYVYRANGKDFEFTEDEIKEQFGSMFAKAANYTEKMQEIAPYRALIATIKEQGIDREKLNLFIDVLKGDKSATAELLKRTGVDALSLDDPQIGDYVPKDYSRSPEELAIDDVISTIQHEPEYRVTEDIIARQWDEGSRREFAANPELIRKLHIDVKTGLYDIVNTRAKKMKVFDGGARTDLEYYKAAGKEFLEEYKAQQAQQGQLNTAPANMANTLPDINTLKAKEEELARREAELKRLEKAKAEQAKRDKAKVDAAKRKAAAPSKSRAGKPDVIDYLDDMNKVSDEEFLKFMETKVLK